MHFEPGRKLYPDFENQKLTDAGASINREKTLEERVRDALASGNDFEVARMAAEEKSYSRIW